jgi:hypothetical protein
MTSKLPGDAQKSGILKWTMLIVFAAVAFYSVYPKFEIVDDTSTKGKRLLINKITGKTYYYSNPSGFNSGWHAYNKNPWW